MFDLDSVIVGASAGACELCFSHIGISEEISVPLAVFLAVLVRMMVRKFEGGEKPSSLGKNAEKGSSGE